VLIWMWIGYVKVKVTLQLTVSQSVYLGVKPKSGTFDQRFFFFFQSAALPLIVSMSEACN
jgi:hypothetical protein